MFEEKMPTGLALLSLLAAAGIALSLFPQATGAEPANRPVEQSMFSDFNPPQEDVQQLDENVDGALQDRPYQNWRRMS